MSFRTDNRYFLSSLNTRLNPLEPQLRAEVYKKEFQKQMRERIILARRSAVGTLQLTDLYRDLLIVPVRYEVDWVLLSIFFEEEAEHLIQALRLEFEQMDQRLLAGCMLEKGLFLAEIPSHDNSLIKGYLKDFFQRQLQVSDIDWREEDATRNSLITLFQAYIMRTITNQTDQRGMLKSIITHFAKLWFVYYSLPFSSKKATVLLHKLITGYQQIDRALLSLNLLLILNEVNDQLTTLIARIPEFPLFGQRTEIGYFLQDQILLTEGYQIKKRNFFGLLENDSIYFEDLSILSWSQLIDNCNLAPGSAIQVYIKEIFRRHDVFQLPNSVELGAISALYAHVEQFRPVLRKVLDKIIQENYIFF